MHVYTTACGDKESRILQIKAILQRGNSVKFVMEDGSYKIVTEWNADADGDLTAEFVSPGMQTKFVCPVSSKYTIEEIKKV